MNRHAAVRETVNLVVEPLPDILPLQLPQLRLLRAHARRSLLCGRDFVGCDRLLEVCAMTEQHVLECVASILEQMPAIGDLHSVGCSSPCSLGVHLGAVPRDEPHGRMRAKPLRDRVYIARGKDVDDAPSIEIDDDGSVAVATTQREVVDADRAWSCVLHSRLGANGSKHGVCTHKHSLTT
jgi:hypothetical protein